MEVVLCTVVGGRGAGPWVAIVIVVVVESFSAEEKCR
jgi:hypothetical protein